jgi:hypothetical protein
VARGQVLVLSHHVYRLLICGSMGNGAKADSGVDLVRDVLIKPVAWRKRADAESLVGLMRSYAFFKSLANSAIVNILLAAKYQVYTQGTPVTKWRRLLEWRKGIDWAGGRALTPSRVPQKRGTFSYREVSSTCPQGYGPYGHLLSTTLSHDSAVSNTHRIV